MRPKKIYIDQDFQRNQLLQPVIHNSDVRPTNPTKGQLFYSTTTISDSGNITTINEVLRVTQD